MISLFSIIESFFANAYHRLLFVTILLILAIAAGVYEMLFEDWNK